MTEDDYKVEYTTVSISKLLVDNVILRMRSNRFASASDFYNNLNITMNMMILIIISISPDCKYIISWNTQRN